MAVVGDLRPLISDIRGFSSVSEILVFKKKGKCLTMFLSEISKLVHCIMEEKKTVLKT